MERLLATFGKEGARLEAQTVSPSGRIGHDSSRHIFLSLWDTVKSGASRNQRQAVPIMNSTLVD